MRGRQAFFGFIIAAAAGLSALPARAQTLADALIAAYRNSNLLDQNQALLRAADEDVAVAVARLRPIINFAIQTTYSSGDREGLFGGVQFQENLNTSAALTANVTLYDFGRSALGIEIAKESVLATREALVNVEQQVLLAAVQAYVNVRLATALVELRESNVRLVTQELRAAQDRFDVGEVTRTDVALAEAQLAAARANLAGAQGDLAVAREGYKAAVGAYPGALAPLPPSPRLPASLEEAQGIAVRLQPQILQAQRNVRVGELSTAAAQAEGRPTIDLSTTARQSQGGLGDQSVTLQLGQTLYSGGQIASGYRRAVAQQEAARSGLLQTVVQVEQAVGNAWSNLIVSRAQIDATGRQIEAAQIAFDGLREEATLGARTTLDVLDAEQDLLNARVDRLNAEASRDLGVYSLLQAMGLLTAQHLRLGIPTYDPAAYYNAVKNAPIHTPQGAALDRILKSIGN